MKKVTRKKRYIIHGTYANNDVVYMVMLANNMVHAKNAFHKLVDEAFDGESWIELIVEIPLDVAPSMEDHMLGRKSVTIDFRTPDGQECQIEHCNMEEVMDFVEKDSGKRKTGYQKCSCS